MLQEMCEEAKNEMKKKSPMTLEVLAEPLQRQMAAGTQGVILVRILHFM